MLNDQKLSTAHTISSSDEGKQNVLQRIEHASCYDAPSAHYITEIFMLKYNREKESMIKIINGTEAQSLTLDHTFKFSKYVTIQSSTGHHFSKAFSALLIVLNEKSEVVSFKPTVGESMKDDSVTDMLLGIKAVSPNIDLIMTDNCCHIRQILNEVYPEATIKLDLWHAFNQV